MAPPQDGQEAAPDAPVPANEGALSAESQGTATACSEDEGGGASAGAEMAADATTAATTSLSRRRSSASSFSLPTSQAPRAPAQSQSQAQSPAQAQAQAQAHSIVQAAAVEHVLGHESEASLWADPDDSRSTMRTTHTARAGHASGRGESEIQAAEEEEEEEATCAANVGGTIASGGGHGDGPNASAGADTSTSTGASCAAAAAAANDSDAATTAGTTIDTAVLDASSAAGGDPRLHAEFVLAYLRQRGLDTAAADVVDWLQREGGGGAASHGRVGNHGDDEDDDEGQKGAAKRTGEAAFGAAATAAGADNSDDDEEDGRKMPAASTISDGRTDDKEAARNRLPTGAADGAPSASSAAATAATAAAAAAGAASAATRTTSTGTGNGSIKQFFTDFGRSIRIPSRTAGGQSSSSQRGGTVGGSLEHSTSGSDEAAATAAAAAAVAAAVADAESAFEQQQQQQQRTGRTRRVMEPGAYAVSIPATLGPRPGPSRRRRFSNIRYLRSSVEVESSREVESSSPSSSSSSSYLDDITFGNDSLNIDRRVPRRDAEEDAPQAADVRRLSSAGSGRIVTVAQATPVQDKVFEASIVDKDAEDGQKRWTTRMKLGTALMVMAMVALIVGLAVALVPEQGSGLPHDIADILLVGEGEACVNPDGQCACYGGHEYIGTQNVTVSGRDCQRWDLQFPQAHAYALSDRFSTVTENYCRTNDAGDASPWCYTTDPEVRWEYCTVPLCETFTVPVELSAVDRLPPRKPICSPDSADGDRQVPEDTSGLYFDGISNHVALTGSRNATSGLNLDGSPFTIEVWIDPEEKKDFSTILSNKDGGAGMAGFLFSINTWEQNNGRLYLEARYSRVASSVSVEWDKWQHVAVTYDSENVSFFIDGVQVPHYPVDEFYGPMNIKPSYLDTRIGEMARYFDGAITAQYNSHFKGVMDELKIWDHARTAEQLRTAMDCQSDGSEEGLIAYFPFDRWGGEGDPLDVYDSSQNGNHGILVDDTERAEEDADVESAEGYRYTEGMSFCADALCKAA